MIEASWYHDENGVFQSLVKAPGGSRLVEPSAINREKQRPGWLGLSFL